MLALKTALAEVDGTPTLIFDEIDQGIGGRVGGVVGRKLWRLTAVGNHQVIVVTHLPQLAGYGDVHFHVSKHVINGRTSTAVTNLDVSGRIGELADMLGTKGDIGHWGAEAILRQVQEDKSRSSSLFFSPETTIHLLTALVLDAVFTAGYCFDILCRYHVSEALTSFVNHLIAQQVVNAACNCVSLNSSDFPHSQVSVNRDVRRQTFFVEPKSHLASTNGQT